MTLEFTVKTPLATANWTIAPAYVFSKAIVCDEELKPGFGGSANPVEELYNVIDELETLSEDDVCRAALLGCSIAELLLNGSVILLDEEATLEDETVALLEEDLPASGEIRLPRVLKVTVLSTILMS